LTAGKGAGTTTRVTALRISAGLAAGIAGTALEVALASSDSVRAVCAVASIVVAALLCSAGILIDDASLAISVMTLALNETRSPMLLGKHSP
jgi:hypothetical protein